MASSKPHLLAVITASKQVLGKFSLRAVKDGKPTSVQLVLDEAGFVPDDIVVIILKEEYDELCRAMSSARHHRLIGDRPYMD